MIDLMEYQIFANNISDLKETSVDFSKGEAQREYMTMSTRVVIDFDGVKNEYIRSLGLDDIPKSNDALFDDGHGSIVFVEFKNGSIDKKTQYAIRKKIYDSTLIFTDIVSKGISYMRANAKYILVYNENQNDSLDGGINLKAESSVQQSYSFDYIAKKIGEHACEEYVSFGLKPFLNYCFKEVHTYTRDEFDEYLSTL